jgi:Raf kinase inhibitor-like YbhB/YbcL family protein
MVKSGILATAAAVALGFALVASGYAADMKPKPFTLTSSSWKDNATVARKYAGKLASNPNCDGDNVSPQISWSNAPAATKSFAILMFDPDGGNGLGAVHWTAYGIPASKTSLKEGEGGAPNPNIIDGAAENGMPGGVYRGPCPPHGLAPHHYIITVIATDLASDALQPGLTRADFLVALKGHTLASSSFIGRYAH